MCGTVLALTGSLIGVPGRQLALAGSPVNPVYLPTDVGHTLLGSAGGWTSSSQVTATGCGTNPCPVAIGAWDDTAGGALRSTLTGSAGHSGVATVTWRSPLFAVPAASTTASFALAATTSYGWTPAPGIAPTYSVHLIDSGTGTLHTVVDSNRLPTPDQGLTTSTAVPLPAGALVPGSVERLEIVVAFPISARAGDATVALSAPTLTVDQRADAAPPRADASALPSLPSLAGAPSLAPSPLPPAEAATEPSTEIDPSGACDAADIAVIGAAGSGRTLTIAGTADGVVGETIDLLSADGWLLGHAVVDAHGHFTAQVAEPTGSAGIAAVLARLPDGRRSTPAPVQRRNVLRSVRAVPAGFSIAGTVDAKLARAGQLRVDLQLPSAEACSPTRAVRATGVRVDRRTGRYRALVPAAALSASAGAAFDATLTQPPLVRTRVTQRAGGRTRVVTTSQVIFGPKSDRRGT